MPALPRFSAFATRSYIRPTAALLWRMDRLLVRSRVLQVFTQSRYCDAMPFGSFLGSRSAAQTYRLKRG